MHYAGIHLSLSLVTTKIDNASFIFTIIEIYFYFLSMHLTEEPFFVSVGGMASCRGCSGLRCTNQAIPF